jgi:heme/copper-type cytochrome/quinol oxidase subunit 3
MLNRFAGWTRYFLLVEAFLPFLVIAATWSKGAPATSLLLLTVIILIAAGIAHCCHRTSSRGQVTGLKAFLLWTVLLAIGYYAIRIMVYLLLLLFAVFVQFHVITPIPQ